VYSCAYFRHPDIPLDEAQRAKLDHICRKLDVQDGCRFLDLGCGWGGLVLYAAEKYGAAAAGCTLSRQQFEYATSLVHRRGLDGRVQVFERDYRDLRGRYDRIASIGMFEHVGRRRLRAYLEKVYSLLACDGLFLNHGIMRPQTISENPASVFWRRNLFPGAELVHLSDVLREAKRVGFELLDVENLRRHYALTCRAWVANLQRNRNECLRFVDPRTYRSWLLLLAGSVVSFEDGTTHVSQVLLAKRRKTEATRLTRDYMYAARS
jgi:cyclopropane-fatty-acyl-phospholipid synthase